MLARWPVEAITSHNWMTLSTPGTQEANWCSRGPRPLVKAFVAKFKAKYGKEPDAFNAYAYDTVVLMGQVMREFGLL